MATKHAMIVSIWHMLTTGEVYKELGADYSSRNNSGRARRRAVAELNQLGHNVELTIAS